MIARLSGTLMHVADGTAEVEVGGITYQLLVSQACERKLLDCIGRTVRLHTHLYLQGQGANALTPVLLGFLDAEEKAFFHLLTTVDGIGPRAAMRLLVEPVAAIALAIERQDLPWLRRLPGIGRQKALELVAKLQGKIAPFAAAARAEAATGAASEPSALGTAGVPAAQGPRASGPHAVEPQAKAEAATAGVEPALLPSLHDETAREVLQVLTQLGYPQAQAEDMVLTARRDHPRETDAAALLAAILSRRGWEVTA